MSESSRLSPQELGPANVLPDSSADEGRGFAQTMELLLPGQGGGDGSLNFGVALLTRRRLSFRTQLGSPSRRKAGEGDRPRRLRARRVAVTAPQPREGGESRTETRPGTLRGLGVIRPEEEGHTEITWLSSL